jgi:hypothetical protein
LYHIHEEYHQMVDYYHRMVQRTGSLTFKVATELTLHLVQVIVNRMTVVKIVMVI